MSLIKIIIRVIIKSPKQGTKIKQFDFKKRKRILSTLLPGRPNNKYIFLNKSYFISIFTKTYFSDEYKGHCVLEACKTGNIPRLKKFLTSETVNFIHPYSGDTPLHAAAVSIDPKRKQVKSNMICNNMLYK